MHATLVVHVVAGGLALAAGYAALYSAKGGPLHRRAGTAFVAAMLVMCTFGLVLAVANDAAPELNVPAALLTAYLVVTSLTTVRPLPVGGRAVLVGGMLLAFGVGAVSLVFGLEAVANGGTRKGLPAFAFFLFGVPGVLGGALDLRLLRSGGLRGAARLTRHLWRMTFALLVAAMSFFFGQADVLPRALRTPALLAPPVVAVLATLLYWLWRVRVRRSLRGLAGVAPEPLTPARPAG